MGKARVMLSFLIQISGRTVVPFSRMRDTAQTYFVERHGFPTNLGQVLINISENNNSNSNSYLSSYSTSCLSSLIIFFFYLGDTIIHIVPLK